MTAGLTSAGLEVETFDSLVTSVCTDYVTRTGVAVDAVGEQAPDGILIRTIMRPLASCWEVLEQIHNAINPDAATGTALAALAALTGTVQVPAASSTVDLLLVGDNTTAVASGSRISAPATSAVWQTLALATLATATSWVASTAYVLNDVRTNASRIYRCITAGTSAGADGPTTTAADIADNTAHWAYVGEGVAIATVAVAAVLTGPQTGVAYSITEIETPVSGWTAAINLLDADLGTDLETAQSLRIRREEELEAQGAGTPEAIRAEMLKVDGVTACTVFYNPTDTTDADGVTPHAVEAMVQGGADQDIWDQLWISVGAGINTMGAEVGTVEDSQGTSQTLRFTRPEVIPIYVEITVEYDSIIYADSAALSAAGTAALVKAAIVAYGDALLAGRDVRARPIGTAVTAGVYGVIDCPSVKIKASAGPTDETTIAVSLRQLATYDTSRITVVESVVVA